MWPEFLDPRASMKHTYYVRQSRLFCMYRNHVLDVGQFLIGKRVLEFGPNKGWLFEKFYPQARSYTLVEPNPAFEKGYLQLQKKHRNLHYRIRGFEGYHTDQRFDTIVMMAVISHIRTMKPEAIVEKIDSLLLPGGHLVVETNNTQRNLDVFDLLDKSCEKLVVKPSYAGLMRRLKIDQRDVLIYRKQA
jgi:2-polyprenyl-3-methyl-5-hydroxy-6-metoxy-1,4-benzoquinol methylase